MISISALYHKYKSKNYFDKISDHVSRVCGSFWALFWSIFIIFLWLLSGPYFHYSDTWQLIMNTAITLIGLPLTFLIQNTVNRNSNAIDLKINELLRANTE